MKTPPPDILEMGSTQAIRLPPRPSSASSTDPLVLNLVAEMTRGWQEGVCPRVEDILARYPHLAESPEVMVHLIYEEVCFRQEQGDSISTTELLERFPQWEEQLNILFECHRLFRDDPESLEFPAEGEEVVEFRIIAELGRGVSSRVFLASQNSLSDRPVVLKFVSRQTYEHLSLARLQHTNIVPLYSIHNDPHRPLLILCMPYFGSKTLGQIIQGLKSLPLKERTGKHILEILDREAPNLPSLPQRGVARKFLSRLSYSSAICWIGICLAEAIQFSHDHGLVHLDLKPSNVLLTAEGQPMLLDFHLAQPPVTPTKAPRWMGGTPAYMSPEQRTALEEIRKGDDLSVTVDASSDIYSLGVLLCEALGAEVSPDCPCQPPTHNSQVNGRLTKILKRCLALRPQDRYPDAGALATDLRRHLNGLPPKSFSNGTLSERWKKWKHRSILVLRCLGIGLLLALIGGAILVQRQYWMARESLCRSQVFLSQHDFQHAQMEANRGSAALHYVPGLDSLRQKLANQQKRVQEAQRKNQQQQLTNGLRSVVDALQGFLFLSTTTSQNLEDLKEKCQSLWERRGQIAQQLNEVSSCEADSADSLLEVALLWMELEIASASPNKKSEAYQQALQVLDEAEELLGTRLILLREQQHCAQALGLKTRAAKAERLAATLVPTSSWEQFALGRFYFREKNYSRALGYFETATEQEPGCFWFQFYQGLCAYRLQKTEQAIRSFTVCIAVSNGINQDLSFVNRGLAFWQQDSYQKALRDYNSAIQRQPHLSSAYLNRGLLFFEQKQNDAE